MKHQGVARVFEDPVPDEREPLARRPAHHHVDGPAESVRPEQLRGLEDVSRYELEPRDEDEEDHRGRAPGFRDDDRGDEPREIVE